MRNIDTGLLNYMKTEYGLESVLVVRVYWNGSDYVDYSDKVSEPNGIQGKVLDISSLDDVIGIDSGAGSVQVNVSLDDSDGTIKQIIDTIDTHKCRVQILQWFTGLSFYQAFPIFSGQMNTPMEWSEGDRVFKFSVLNQVENLEIGFSLEDGDFRGLQIAIAGKAFPMVFGTAQMVPSLIIGAPPSGLLSKGFGIVYTNVFDDEIANLQASYNTTQQLARDQSVLYGAAEVTAPLYNDGRDDSGTANYRDGINQYQDAQNIIDARIAGSNYTRPPTQVGSPPDDYSTYVQYYNAGQQHRANEIKYEGEMQTILGKIQSLKDQQAALLAVSANGDAVVFKVDQNHPSKELGDVFLASLNFNFQKPTSGNNGGGPPEFHIEINGSYFITGAPKFYSELPLIAEEAPPNLRPYDPYFALYKEENVSKVTQSTKTSVKFKWFDAGTRVRFLDVPCYYIACYGQSASITGVWAKSKGMHVPVPQSYYEIGPIRFSNGDAQASAQVVTMNLALTSILDASGNNIYDSDEIWCDIIGEVGPHYTDIVNYILVLFSTLHIDPVSTITVATQTIFNPMNFVLFERKPIMDFLREISFQAKVSAWVDDQTVKFRFLSAEPDPVATITPADLVEDSLVITSTTTEELVTKMQGTWKSIFSQVSNNVTTLRYNMAKYGLHEESVNYYAFTTAELVQRSLAFWVIRKGTVWKKIKFKTFINFLNVESHDPVTFSGFDEYFSCQDVVGTIETASYDSSSMTIDFEAWLPIKWGDSCQTPLAYPSDQATFYGQPNDPDFKTGNPFQNVVDSAFNGIGDLAKQTYKNSTAEPPLGQTQNFNIQDTPLPGLTPTTAVAYTNIKPVRPAGMERANDKNTYEIKELPRVTLADQPSGNADMGTVIELTDVDQTYKVQLQGTNTIVLAKQQLIADGFRVADGAVVYLLKKSGKWLMQHPVWSKETDAPSP